MNVRTAEASLYRSIIRPVLKAIYSFGPNLCPACGRRTRLRKSQVIGRELSHSWELSPQLDRWFDQREGVRCTNCSNSLRTRQLASVIVDQLSQKIGTSAADLRSLCNNPKASKLTVAEINSSGGLHQFLALLPGLHYSEYGGLPGVPSEDLACLSYSNDMFDLVLTSDTLEHVPDLPTSLAEIRRVLKPDGLHIFTIPIIWDRETRVRATIQNGKLVHHMAPSYHGEPSAEASDLLVFQEFGADFEKMLQDAGFGHIIVMDPVNPTLTTFVAWDAINRSEKIESCAIRPEQYA